MGRTAVGGTVVHRATYGTENLYETFFVALSFGGIFAIEAMTLDRVVVPFSGSAATGYYGSWAWSDNQTGAMPEADALTNGIVGAPPWGTASPIPSWGAAYKLSGHAAASITFRFDKSGGRYANGEPVPGWVLQGAKVYDPRLDSTYPGGSGSCRWADPSDAAAFAACRVTWVYSETPALHGLMWRLGVWAGTSASGFKRAMGIGAPIDTIDLAAIVASANVQEANGWKVGGQVDSGQGKWEVLKLIEQAGGAVPIATAARMSTLQRAPRVALATITEADLADGGVVSPGMVSRKTLLNGYRARIRSEAHGWEMADLDIVQAAGYVTADGREKTGSGDLSLVQDADQGASLAAYEMFDSRELTGIVLPLKPRWAEYRLGECLALDLPSLLLTGLDVIVKGRTIDPATGKVTLTLDTETSGKHAVALGQTGTLPPPPTIGLLTFDVPAPPSGDWAVAGTSFTDNGLSIPAVVVTGATSSLNADGVVFDIRPAGVGAEWSDAAIVAPGTKRKEFTGVTPGTSYEVGVRYRVRGVVGARLVLGPVTAGDFSVVTGARGLRTRSVAFPLTPGDGSISVAAFDGTVDGVAPISFPAATLSGLAGSTSFGVFWNLTTSGYETEVSPAATRMAAADFVYLGSVFTSTAGVFPTAPSAPSGTGGNGSENNSYL